MRSAEIVRGFVDFDLISSLIAIRVLIKMANTNKAARKTLTLRLELLTGELATCRTAAQKRCVEEAIADTRRQLAALG